MKSDKVVFTTPSGKQKQAYIDKPTGGMPVTCALFIHCFGKMHQDTVDHISLALTQNKIEVMRMDMTDPANDVASEEDVIAAYEFLRSTIGAPKLIVGHSVAGGAVLASVAKMPEVQAIAVIGAPAADKYLYPILDEDMAEEEAGEIVYKDGHFFEIDLHLLDEFNESRMQNHVESLRKALLIMHSPQDRHIAIDSAADLYKAARHPKSFITLDGSDHFLSSREDSLYAGNMIAAWLQKYLDLTQPADLRTHMEVVTRTRSGSFTTEIRAGNHSLLADEPISYGGNNLGPNPYDFLNAALGACTGMTLKMYADRKKWPLKEAIVHLKHDKVYMEDCNVCDERDSKLDQLTREVELIGNLDEEQRKRLMEIADKCPVHKTLTGKITIKTQEIMHKKTSLKGKD